VITSDVRFAGCDADVIAEFKGTLGSFGPCALENSSNNFERGRRDDFVLSGPDIGSVTSVQIWHMNNALGSDWHLQEVQVYHPAENQTYYFPCNDWLKGPTTGHQNRKDLQAGVDASGKCSYNVKVFTSDERGAGTDADVFINLIGEMGGTGERELANSSNNFERGRLDCFTLYCEDIGQLTAAEVCSSPRPQCTHILQDVFRFAAH
jgi:lipoxygenase homology domain-containing protein 1